MSGKAIGKTLPLGFRGNVSRTPDVIIESFCNVGTKNIEYGAPVYFANGGVKAVDASATASNLIGIAVRHMGQPYADDAQGWYYKPGDTVDVLVRGSVIVELSSTSGVAAKGGVYVTAATGELSATSSGNVALPNTVFSGNVETDTKLAEVTILSRAM